MAVFPGYIVDRDTGDNVSSEEEVANIWLVCPQNLYFVLISSRLRQNISALEEK